MRTATRIWASPTASHRTVERQVDTGEEPSVQRLRVGGRNAREEPECAVLDEVRGEAIALVDELSEDGLALARQHGEPGQCCGENDDRNGD